MGQRNLPSGPVVSNTVLPMQGAQVRSLVGELRHHVMGATAKKKRRVGRIPEAW